MSEIDLKAANTVRILSGAMVEKAGSGHPGGAMGASDYIHTLYSKFLNDDPDDAEYPWRDRFFLDAGHMSPMLYSILALSGRIELSQLENFRQWGSHTPGHPEIDHAHGIENTSGPLGQGHTYGVGAAIAERFLRERFGKWTEHKTYLFISDGGIQEEISQGAGRLAGHLGLGNLIMFYDSNDVQLSSKTKDVTSEDTAAKYRAWGWNVVEIDGNDFMQIEGALEQAQTSSKPNLIIGKTIMGKGAVDANGDPFEGQVSMHGQPMSAAGADFDKTISALGGNPSNPFVIAEDVAKLYEESTNRKRKIISEKKASEKSWRAENPNEAAELDSFLSGKTPEINWEEIASSQKENIATRASSSHVLAAFADNIPNMIVMSADLANSDKTDGFLKKSQIFTRDNFAGQFMQAGVSELTMAAVAVGMSLHGGVIPVCGTFFAFSDYMKPVLRMAALMQQPVKFMWTHDAFRVGEDGPTHQPIEQEAQLRLLEKLHNHDGKPGLLALRPADSAETTVAWKMAMENTDTPTGLILTRQNVKDLPMKGISRFEDAKHAEQGAYIVQEPVQAPELVVIANGSEVSTALDAAKLLPDSMIRIVSVPSEGKFREQPEEYQNEVLPERVPRAGITAGLSVNLLGLVGDIDRIHGLNHFGFSAPYTILDEKFGFTPEAFAEKLKTWL
jgi:transketolase